MEVRLEPCAGRADAVNLWAPPPTFDDRRAAAADNLPARRRCHFGVSNYFVAYIKSFA